MVAHWKLKSIISNAPKISNAYFSHTVQTGRESKQVSRRHMLKNSLYELGSALFVQMLDYFGFTTQLVYATCC